MIGGTGGIGGGGNFIGYASFRQDTPTQTDADQDDLMVLACDAAFPGTRPASTEELSEQRVSGLPPTNDSGQWLMSLCPECEGIPGSIAALSGQCRVCVKPGVSWPVDYPFVDTVAWHDYCCTSTRSIACIQ